MPDDVVIKVENLSKQYRIGVHEGYKTFRETLVDTVKVPFVRLRGAMSRVHGAWSKDTGSPLSSHDDTIWALKDVSFEVKQGEVVGIIGRNGAGKSTLLKILSKITEPTEGRVELKGRIGSLLEVGTGFHPELTGHENVYLYGAILGMDRWEVTRKFDEIVAFAEIEKFIDTPVKRYSSGMYMRLAFAVAAYMETEILLVDEVLAVGDAAFQKKCLGKMGDVSKEGRTVLFVSHNMGAINRLCRTAILLDEGKIKIRDHAETVISKYLYEGSSTQGERNWIHDNQLIGNDKIRLRAIRISNYDNITTATIDIRRSFFIEIEYDILEFLSDFRVAIRVIAGDGTVVFTSSDTCAVAMDETSRSAGRYISRCEIPGNFLNEGPYTITVSADIPFVEILFFEENVLSFYVEQVGGLSGRYSERWPGVICPNLKWIIEYL